MSLQTAPPLVDEVFNYTSELMLDMSHSENHTIQQHASSALPSHLVDLRQVIQRVKYQFSAF